MLASEGCNVSVRIVEHIQPRAQAEGRNPIRQALTAMPPGARRCVSHESGGLHDSCRPVRKREGLEQAERSLKATRNPSGALSLEMGPKATGRLRRETLDRKWVWAPRRESYTRCSKAHQRELQSREAKEMKSNRFASRK